MPKIRAKEYGEVELGNFLFVTGLLFEVNRTVFHPLGYALMFDVVEGLTMLDFGDNPEKAVFDEENYSRGIGKLKQFLDEIGYKRVKQRKAELGFVVQGDKNFIGTAKNR